MKKVRSEIARRRGKAEALNRDVEVETIDACAILDRIDNAQGRVDAQHAQILM